MESIKENPPIPPIDSSPSSDDIPWKLFNIKVFHNNSQFGSAHSLYRHQHDFFFLKKEQRRILNNINKGIAEPKKEPVEIKNDTKKNLKTEETPEETTNDVNKNLEPEETPEYKQGLVNDCRKIFNATKTPFLRHMKHKIDNSKQTLITFSRESIKLHVRSDLDPNVVKYWRMVCSDGTRRDEYESNEDVKLITLHKLDKKKSKKLSTRNRQWYVFGKQTKMIMDKDVGNQEGIFIEFNEDVIKSQYGIFLKLFRDDNPEWKNENDEKLKIRLRSLLTSFKNDIKMENNNSQPLETGSAKKGKQDGSNKKNKDNGGSNAPANNAFSHAKPVKQRIKNTGVPSQKSIDVSVLPSDLNDNARKTPDGNGSDQRRKRFPRQNKKKSNQPSKENDQEQTSPDPTPLAKYQSCRKNSVVRASQLSLCSQASSTNKNRSRNRRRFYYRNHIKEGKMEYDSPREASTSKSSKRSQKVRANNKMEEGISCDNNFPNSAPETE